MVRVRRRLGRQPHGRRGSASPSRCHPPSAACSSPSAARWRRPLRRTASNRQIADELVLAIDTVKGTLSRLFELFELDGLPQNQKRSALAQRALETGSCAPTNSDQ